MAALKVGINGFGRIGRLVFRAGISASTTWFPPITWPTCWSMTRPTASLTARLTLSPMASW